MSEQITTTSLEHLNITGLQQSLVGSFRAGPPLQIQATLLGALANLPGTWVGKGFNVVALPNFHNHGAPLPFQLKLANTFETLTFTAIGGPIPNRGDSQDDIKFLGVHYFQQVSNALDNSGMHVEPGMWLNLPATTSPNSVASLARLSTIPHGDALMAQGALINNGNPFAGAPPIAAVDTTPFTLNAAGARQNDTNPAYNAPYKAAATFPAGITAADVNNPNLLLQAVIDSQKAAGNTFVQTTTLRVDANPLANLNGAAPPITTPPTPVGGITNIPFVVKNANANTLSAIFWVEEIKDPSGNTFLQLQYTQTVILEFIGIKWPHISVATLVKQ